MLIETEVFILGIFLKSFIFTMGLNKFDTQTESYQRISLQFNTPKLMTFELNLIPDDFVKTVILSS